MKMEKEYTLNSHVTACQWTGYNLNEIIDFLGKDIVDYKDKKLYIYINDNKKEIKSGDYIIKTTTGKIIGKATSESFNKFFDEIKLLCVDESELKDYNKGIYKGSIDNVCIKTPTTPDCDSVTTTIEDWGGTAASEFKLPDTITASEFDWPEFNIPLGSPESTEEAFDDIYNKAQEYSKKDSEKYESNFKDLIESEKIYSEKHLEDMVNHPKHYQSSNGIECIDAIIAATEDKSGPEAVMVGQIIRYLWRYEKKWNKVEDIKKAQFYLNELIKIVEK